MVRLRQGIVRRGPGRKAGVLAGRAIYYVDKPIYSVIT